MENKKQFLHFLKENKGQHNEIELGEQLGLTEDETQRIIAQLLAEHRLFYEPNGACNYSIHTKKTVKSTRKSFRET